MLFSEFLRKAKLKHGDTYSYIEFWGTPVLTQEKHRITCKEHGVFLQAICSHLQGRGCPACGRKNASPPPRSKMLPWSGVVELMKKRHAGKYMYPTPENYTGRGDKVKIVCPKHGIFVQGVQYHLGGGSCPQCAIERNSRPQPFSAVLKKFRKKHGDRYEYHSPENYGGVNTAVTVVCPIHGEYKQTPVEHLAGCGCRSCGINSRSRLQTLTLETCVARSRTKHGDNYDYSSPSNQDKFTGAKGRLDVICPKHGMFEVSLEHHMLGGQPCPRCEDEVNYQTFVERAHEVHQHIYEYLAVAGEGVDVLSQYRHQIVCKKHGVFEQTAANHLQGTGCPKCKVKTSKAECDIYAWLQFLLGKNAVTQTVRRDILPGLKSYEVDIVVWDKKIAIEFDGLIWHSEKFSKKFKTAHLNKTKLLESLGYQLIHIFEDEWGLKKSAVKARLEAILMRGSSIYARKTKVELIPWRTAKEFLDTVHLQSAGVPSKQCLGLRFEGKLVAVATFGASRYTDDRWELLRFGSKGRVIGGLGKLIKAFSRKFAEPGETLISYADRRWSTGGVYKTLGFNFVGHSSPGYAYITGARSGRRHNRVKFQKHKLAKLFDNFDPALTEAENCNKNGFYRIYDCGTSKWRLTL